MQCFCCLYLSFVLIVCVSRFYVSLFMSRVFVLKKGKDAGEEEEEQKGEFT